MGGALLLVFCPAPRVATALEVSGDHRLVQRFVEDGAIVQKAWFGALADYDRFEGGQDLAGTILLGSTRQASPTRRSTASTAS